MKLSPFSFLLLMPIALGADSLSELKATLGKLQGQESLRVQVDHQFWKEETDDKKPVVTQGKAQATVEDGPQGLRFQWSRPLVQQALQEARENSQNPEKSTPVRTAIEQLGATEVLGLLASADPLLQELNQAQVQEEKTESYNGQPAKLLVLKVEPKIPADQRKYLKELRVDAKIWIGPDGIPLASVQKVYFKGSRMFITFEGSNNNESRYARIGNRLVSVYRSQETYGSGLGHTSKSKQTTTLSLN